MSGKSGTDGRFSYEHWQIVVVGLCVFPLREQEVAGSNPVAPTDRAQPLRPSTAGLLFFPVTRYPLSVTRYPLPGNRESGIGNRESGNGQRVTVEFVHAAVV